MTQSFLMTVGLIYLISIFYFEDFIEMSLPRQNPSTTCGFFDDSTSTEAKMAEESYSKPASTSLQTITEEYSAIQLEMMQIDEMAKQVHFLFYFNV